MSRSYKKAYSYFSGFKSLQEWKKGYNRRFRRSENLGLKCDDEFHCSKNPFKTMYADVWMGPADGKACYLSNSDVEDFYSGDYGKSRVFKSKRNGKYMFHK